MPTCVECGAAVTSLYTVYSPGNIRLTQCSQCKQFADRYVEFDFVIIFIDLLLQKPQVYRHLLFNRLPYRDRGIDPNVLKLGILLILFDVYIKWFRIEQQQQRNGSDENLSLWNAASQVWSSETQFVAQYLYILSFCFIGKIIVQTSIILLEFLAFHGGICLAVRASIGSRYAIVKYNYVSMALIVSSFGKLLVLLMVIWDYQALAYTWLVHLIMFASNAEALAVFLQTSHLKAYALLACGLLARLWVQVAVRFWDSSIQIHLV